MAQQKTLDVQSSTFIKTWTTAKMESGLPQANESKQIIWRNAYWALPSALDEAKKRWAILSWRRAIQSRWRCGTKNSSVTFQDGSGNLESICFQKRSGSHPIVPIYSSPQKVFPNIIVQRVEILSLAFLVVHRMYEVLATVVAEEEHRSSVSHSRRNKWNLSRYLQTQRGGCHQEDELERSKKILYILSLSPLLADFGGIRDECPSLLGSWVRSSSDIWCHFHPHQSFQRGRTDNS